MNEANMAAQVKSPPATMSSSNTSVDRNQNKQVNFRFVKAEEDEKDPANDSGNCDKKNNDSRSRTVNCNSKMSSNPSENSWTEESDSSVSRCGSAGSLSAVTATTSTTTLSIPLLGERLLRTQKHRDPLRYYQVIRLLGEGSMGSVCKVRKRTFGGSARKSFVEDEKKAHRTHTPEPTPSLCWPCFLFCFPGISASRTSKDLLFEATNNTSNSDQTASSSNSGATSTRATATTCSSGSHMASIESSVDPPESAQDDSADDNFSERAKKQRGYTNKRKTSSIVSFGTEVSVDFALKTIILDQCMISTFQRELLNEIEVLRSLDHPNIVRAVETYDYKNRLYLVLELCSGGDLYTRDPYTERQAKNITYNLLDAIAYLHSKKITHRDLKFENVMFTSPTTNTVKIIDFGLSKKYGKSDSSAKTTTMNETVGTIYTMAPEVLKGEYDEKCDVWSMGVLAFMLISSSIPFYGKTRADVVTKILHGNWAFKGREWRDATEEAKACVGTMLIQDACQRPAATEVMQDVWFQKDGGCDQGDDLPISVAVMDRVQAAILTFGGYSRLKKLALLVIAHQSIDEEIGVLRRLFLQRFDTEKACANVSYPEFKDALLGYNYTEKELMNMFNGIDIDATGKITFTEFLAASIEAHGSIEEERIAEAFDRIDGDDTGYITVENLRDILGTEVSGAFVDEMIDEVKTEGDRHISYEDFLGLWDSGCDETLRLALEKVQRRRIERENSNPIPSNRPNVSNDESTGGALVSYQSSYDPEDGTGGGGHSFFDKEKAKSLRGIWI